MQQPIHIIPVTTRRCEQFALQQPAKTKVPCFSYHHAQCLGGPASPGGVGRKRSKEGKKHTHTKERGKSLICCHIRASCCCRGICETHPTHPGKGRPTIHKAGACGRIGSGNTRTWVCNTVSETLYIDVAGTASHCRHSRQGENA
jgi:hypothetical protein